MAYERKCIVCGSEYRYCPRCAEFKSMPTWMLQYDSENCKSIDKIVNNYVFGHINAEEAKIKLDECNIKINLSEDINIYVNDIVNSSSVKKKSKKKNELDNIVNEVLE